MLVVRLADETGGYLPTGAFESFRADLGLTYSQASIVLAVIGVAGLAGAVFTVAADHVSRRAIAAGGALGYATSLTVFATAPSFAALLVAAAVLGVAATAMVDAAEVALVDEAGDELDRHLARQNLLGAVGDFVGPGLVIGVTALGLSWRVAFATGAVLLGAYGVWLASLPLPRPRPNGDGETARDGLRIVLRDPRVWFVGVLAMLLVPLDEPYLAFLIATLVDRGSSTAIGNAVAALTIVGFLAGLARRSRPGAPRASDGHLPRAATIMAAGTALTLAPTLPVVALGALVFGWGLAGFWVTLQSRMYSLHRGRAGTVKGVVTVLELGGFALPLVAGIAADAGGAPAGLATFLAFAVVLIALATLARAVPTPRVQS